MYKLNNPITVLQGEAGYNITQFGNFGRSRYGDDTLEIAAAPRTKKSTYKYT